MLVRVLLPLASVRQFLQSAGWFCTSIGVGCLGWWAYGMLEYQIFRFYGLREFASQLGQTAENHLSPSRSHDAQIGPDPPRGQVLGRLDIPRIGLSAIVLEGSDERTLELGVGHIESTSLPGQPGNIGLAGHRDTVLLPLRDIRLQDDILLTSRKGAERYVVTDTMLVSPSQIDVLNQTDQPTLTLVTCYPFDYVGPAPLRFIVRSVSADRIAEGAEVEDE